MRDAEPADRAVLRRVRDARSPGRRRPLAARNRRLGPAPAGRRARRRATPGHGPVRRPRRLHRAVRGPRRRGGPRAAVELLRARDRRHRALRRHASRSSSATRSWPCGARRSRTRTTPSGRSAPASTSSTPCRRSGPAIQARVRRAHRRGGGHARRDRARAWSRATSSTRHRACSRSRRAGAVLVGEATQRATSGAIAFEAAGEQLLKGKARPCRRGGRCGSSPSAAAAAATTALEAPFVGRDDGAAPAQGPVPRDGTRAPGPARVGHRPGRHRQEPARLGVPEVPRRPRRDRSTGTRADRPAYGEGITFWALGEMVRRAPACSRPTTRPRRARASPRCSRSTCPTRTSDGGSSRRCSRCSGRATPRPAGRRSCSPPGARSSSGSRRTGVGRAGVRGPPLGRPGHARLHRAPARVEPQRPDPDRHARPARAARAAAGLGRRQAGVPRPRPRAARRRRRCASCSAGSSPGLPEAAVRVDRRARRGHPAVRGRDHPDARRRRPAARARGRHRVRAGRRAGRARRAGDAARADRRAPRRARHRGPRPGPGRGRPRPDLHVGGLAAVAGLEPAGARRSGSTASSGASSCAARSTRGRPSAASTRSSRRSSARSPTPRWRGATGAAATSRPRGTSSRSATTSSPAPSPATTSPPTARRPRVPRPRRWPPRRGSRCAPRPSGRSRSARPARPSRSSSRRSR